QECVLPGYPKEMIERYKKFASMLSLVVNKYAYAIMTEKNRIIMENHLSALVENYFPGKDCKVKVEFNQMKGKANIKLPEWIEKFAKRYFCESCGSEIVDHNQLCHRFGEQFDGM
ncbi:MAG TPA: hypothetical protein VK253_00920, partial [Candidatus Binatia bacterium]|nr:hypothetical protein [Candidatus Binatia bacterium]